MGLLLPHLPDPDQALNGFERLVEQSCPELISLLSRRTFAVHGALAVFSHSRFLGDTLVRNPHLLEEFSDERLLGRGRSVEELRSGITHLAETVRASSNRTRNAEPGIPGAEDTSLLLARFKRQEYVRIMLGDVLGRAGLAQTTAEISRVADALIAEALKAAEGVLHRRYGPPSSLGREGMQEQTPFVVFALGKLGGNELNYSSDVDLLYVYGDGEDAPAAALGQSEYFIRLSQLVTDILSRATAEGAALRVDLRLRPQGGEGAPAIALGKAVEYYTRHARDWERQALIKLRFCAGNEILGRNFIAAVQPAIYGDAGGTLNFAAIETALDARLRLQRRPRTGRRTPPAIDVKLDRGGIRDIEFLVQCLQRVYGGGETWLRARGTLFALQKLHDKGHLSGKDFHQLSGAYEFLRNVEHRLQLRDGQQTHQLPSAPKEMAVLSASLSSGDGDRGSFIDELGQRMQAVAAVYDRIIHHEQQPRAGANAPQPAVSSFNRGFAHVLERLAEDAPCIAALARRDDLDATTRRHVERWLSSAAATPERYARVIAAPEAAEKALLVLQASEYVADVLARFPQDVAVFGSIEQDTGAAPCRPGYLFPEQEQGEALSRLREVFRQRMLACVARNIFETPSVYVSLARTTAAADEAIRSALAVAGGPAEFAVLALGRLGTCEFDLLSDADLLFVRSERLGAEPAAAVAERVIQALAAYTSEGTVFPVDARLRPRGGEGELVVTARQLRNYLLDEAQPWEALTFTKLRGVAGSEALREQGLAATAEGMKRFAADPGLVRHVREMRARVEAAGQADFKTGYGGIYDIDFLASYLLVRACRPVAANLDQRLKWLCQHGALLPPDASELSRSAELLRTVEHAVRLVTGRIRETLPASQHSCRVIERLVSEMLRRRSGMGLELELEQARGSVRQCFDRLLQ